MTEATSQKQIEDWKTELTSAMAEQKWRRALQLCSWLRYTLDQQGRSDLEVEEIHQKAKMALDEQIKRERAEHERQIKHRDLRRTSTSQIISGNWLQALDAIEAFYQNEASQEETLDLLQAFQARLSDRRAPAQPPTGTRATELKQRFDEILEQIQSDA